MARGCLVTVLLLCLLAPSGSAEIDNNGTSPSPPPENGNATATTASPGQSYKEAEKEITDFINGLLRSLLPQIVGGSGEAKLSSRCTAAMMKVFANVRRLKGWTVKMLDSMGKPSSGILSGTSFSVGDYDQCLNLSVTKKGNEARLNEEVMFQGQYCRIRISFPEVVVNTATAFNKGKLNASDLGRLRDIIEAIPYIPVKANYMSHFIGLCFPSMCTTGDIQELVKLIPFPGKSTVEQCETKENSEVDHTQLIVICIFTLLFILVCVSTLIDWVMQKSNDEKTLHHKKSRCFSVSVAFSLCSNTKNLMRNVEDDSDSLLRGHCVRGVVVAATAWFILGHVYLYPSEGYFLRASYLGNLQTYWDFFYFAFIVNYPLAIDVLIVCYGFILSFTIWHSSAKAQEVDIHYVRLIVKNYFRLCVPVAMCLGVIALLPLLGSGPFFHKSVSETVEKCRTHAGGYFGMYANFLDLENQCFPHLWFIPCLAQLMLLGIFLCWILSKSVKVGALITILLSIGCDGVVSVLTFKNNLPPSFIAYFTEESSSYFWRVNMALPLSHIAPYSAGLLAGILVARKENHRSKTCVGAIGWAAFVAIVYGLMLAPYSHRHGSMSKMYSALYAGLHRTVFGTCIAWVLVACSFGIGGFVDKIFSWKIFDPLFRLSYYAYTFHAVIIVYTVGIAREHFSYSHVELILRTFSYVGLTYLASYLLSMLFGMPFKSLQLSLCPKTSRRIEVTPLNNLKLARQGEFIAKSAAVKGECKLWSVTETSGIEKF